MSKYTMTIDFQVLNHLGINLYSNMPAVISEVVANAWDADAENVQIELSQPDVATPEIKISDDGNGMDLNDINNKFLKVGYQKRLASAKSEKHNRPVMGRKGIGKLSLFSIAKNITILSRKTVIDAGSGKEIISKNAFQIDTDKLNDMIKSGGTTPYEPAELPEENVKLEKDGTIIILRALKRRTRTLEKYLKRRLARRFSVIGADNNFNIAINGTPIEPKDREYISRAQYIWFFGDKKYQDKCLEQKNPAILKKHHLLSGDFEFHGKKYFVYGWLATATEPGALTDEDGESINRIVIMVRGKMAKEDILSEFNETGLYTKYIFGELFVDFLDSDGEDDITTSNRQDFFEDDERYLALKDFVSIKLKEIKKEWTELRNSIGVEVATRIEVVKEWFYDLEGDDKTAAKSLFGKINQLTIDNGDKEELVRHSILAFETLKLKNCLSEFDTIAPENISAFIKAAEKLNTIEASYYYKIVRERIAVIKKMKEVTDVNALEKVVQEHLAKNLWLIDPSWDRGTEAPHVEETIKKQFEEINAHLPQEQQDARLDVRYKKASGRHVIIELKRAGRKVIFDELSAQVRKYSMALEKIMEKNKDHEPFEIIALIGRSSDETNIFSERDCNALAQFKTRVMYYDELISNAEKMYSDFLDKNKKATQMYDRFIASKKSN